MENRPGTAYQPRLPRELRWHPPHPAAAASMGNPRSSAQLDQTKAVSRTALIKSLALNNSEIAQTTKAREPTPPL